MGHCFSVGNGIASYLHENLEQEMTKGNNISYCFRHIPTYWYIITNCEALAVESDLESDCNRIC